MKINRFEELDCWKEARKLVKLVYDVVNSNEYIKKDYRFRDQITSAAISTMSNIAEGFSRRTNKEFVQYLFISKASSSEVQSLFYAALDLKYVPKEVFDSVYNQAEIVSKLDSGLITYLLKRKRSSN